MTNEALKTMVRAMAIVCVTVGGVGSILCLPFAVTNDWTLVRIAGTYFVAGGIMITGGLISLSILIQPQH